MTVRTYDRIEDEKRLAASCAEKYRLITKRLIEKAVTVTAMESCTSGMLASLVTDTEGASAVFKGAYIAYSNEARIRAGVPGEVLERYGVYSVQTAESMASQVAKHMNADIGIGVTGGYGVADSANPDSVPGVVMFAIVCAGEVQSYTIDGIPYKKRHYAKLYVAERVAEELLKVL